MTTTDLVWAAGRLTIGTTVRIFAPLRNYGPERVPLSEGVVLAFNHFHWLDPAAFGAASPRTINYMAKIEAHRVPGLGELIRSFGTFSVRRGESDREAVRLMRAIVRGGGALGIFVEGTRQREGHPGHVQPGAAMAALQENVPVVCAAIHGTETWRPLSFRPVSIAWSEPMHFDGLPRNGRGYREASVEIERKLTSLWAWLGDVHDLGRPRVATPPA
jgi:1-acyl-sn-glycerol-3-phosphate acyltransferase